MLTATNPSPEFKRAAINWLLANGTCDAMDDSTGTALARLSVLGVDYDATEMPSFGTVAIEPGDSFTEATYGEAFTCRVLPIGYNPQNWREGHEFWVGKDDIMQLMLSTMIMGVISAAETGESEWKARANQREVERLERHRAADAERERRAAAAATKTEKKG